MAVAESALPAGPRHEAVVNSSAPGGGQTAPSAAPPLPHTTPFAAAPASQADVLASGGTAGASAWRGTTSAASAQLTSAVGPSRQVVPSLSATGGGQTTPSAAPPPPPTTPLAVAPGLRAGVVALRSAEGMAQPQFSRPEEVPGFASTVLVGSALAGQQSQPTQGPPEAAGQAAIPTPAPSDTSQTMPKDVPSGAPASKARPRAKT